MVSQNISFEQEIFSIVKANPQRYGKMLRAKGSAFHKESKSRQHLLEYVFQRTDFLDSISNIDLRTRLLYLRNPDITVVPTCVICSKKITKLNARYFPGVFGEINDFLKMQTCCRECSNKLAQLHREEYFREHYGEDVVNTFQLEKTKKKITKTKIENHNDPNYNNVEKAKETNLEKYGKASFFQTNEFKEKFKQTMLERFSVDHQMRSEKIRKEMSERYLEKHGVLYSTQDPKVISKMHWKYEYEGLKFDSAWEIVYYKHLKENNIDFQYQPTNVIFSYVSDGKERHYYPDFVVDNIVHEIKGDHLLKYYGDPNKVFNRSDYRAMQAKIQFCFKLEKEGKLKFITFKEIKPIFDKITKEHGFCFRRWVSQFKVHKEKA